MEKIKQTQKLPKVTIAIPTYNRVRYVKRAVQSALNQTYKNVEIIVSDNASPDNTVEEVGKFKDERLVIIKQVKNLGLAGNFNTCLNKATGEYFILLSDDDYLEPTAIEELVNPFLHGIPALGIKPDKVGMVYSQARIVDENYCVTGYSKGAPVAEPTVDLIKLVFSGERGPYLCGIMLRTSDMLAVGGYDDVKYSLALDSAMWMNVILKYDYVAFVQKVLSNYMMHRSNATIEAFVSHWETADRALVKLCINYYKTTGKHALAREIQDIGTRYLTRKVANFVSARARRGGSRLTAVREFIRFSHHFQNIYGLRVLTYSIVKLLIPNRVFNQLIQLKNPVPYS